MRPQIDDTPAGHQRGGGDPNGPESPIPTLYYLNLIGAPTEIAPTAMGRPGRQGYSGGAGDQAQARRSSGSSRRRIAARRPGLRWMTATIRPAWRTTRSQAPSSA